MSERRCREVTVYVGLLRSTPPSISLATTQVNPTKKTTPEFPYCKIGVSATRPLPSVILLLLRLQELSLAGFQRMIGRRRSGVWIHAGVYTRGIKDGGEVFRDKC